MWMSNTATTALLCPIADTILRQLGAKPLKELAAAAGEDEDVNRLRAQSLTIDPMDVIQAYTGTPLFACPCLHQTHYRF